MNPQNPNSGQMPNVPMQQAQFTLIGASTENVRAQEASSAPWQSFLPQQDRESMINRFLQAMRQFTGVANDRIIGLSRNFEQQCYGAAGSLQNYYALCSQKIAQVTNSTQQQKAMNPQYQNQFQQQQANQPTQAQKLQQIQQGNIQQLQGQPLQNMQAQQLQQHILLQKHLQMQQQQQQGNASINPLQPQQMQNLQQQKLLAQMTQNMGLNMNASNFMANNMAQGGINPPSLGRPRPNQGLPTGPFPGASAASGMGVQSPANNVQPMRPPVGLSAGLPGGMPMGMPTGMPAGMPSLSNMTSQQFAQLSTNPNFLAMLQQRGINPQHAKSFLYNQIQNAALISQISNNSNMQAGAANQAEANPVSNAGSNPQPNPATPIANPSANAAPSPAFQKGNMEPVSGQFTHQQTVPAGFNQPNMSAAMASKGSEYSQSPAVGSQPQMMNQAQALNQKAFMNEAMRFRPQGPVPGQGMPDPRAIVSQMGPISYPMFLKTVEQSKAELLPKIKAMTDNSRPFPILEDVSSEEREKIYSFFPQIPSLLKTIDDIMPFIYVFTNFMEIPRSLVIFKTLLEAQQKIQPQLCMTLDVIERIKVQVANQADVVRAKVQRIQALSRMAESSANKMPAAPLGQQGIQESPIKPEAAMAPPSLPGNVRPPQGFVNASPRNEPPGAHNLNPAVGRMPEPAPPKPPLGPASLDPLPQPPAAQNQVTSMPPKIEETAEPVQAFKSQIPIPDIALRLPAQKTATPKSDPELPKKAPETPKPATAERRAEPPVASHESPLKRKPAQEPEAPAAPLSKLARVELEMHNARAQFKGQPMNHVLASLKKLRAIDGGCRFRINAAKTNSSRFGSAFLYHYNDGPSDGLLSKLPSTQYRPVFGFGDLPQKP